MNFRQKSKGPQMPLTTEQLTLVETRVANDAKSTGVAYLLAIFLGGLGAHRFYLGRTGSGIAQLVMFILGWLTLALVVGGVFLLIVGIWVLVDLFLIPGMVTADKAALRERISKDLSIMSGTPAE
jgi:TM2 domain-containing membrane protein YozV